MHNPESSRRRKSRLDTIKAIFSRSKTHSVKNKIKMFRPRDKRDELSSFLRRKFAHTATCASENPVRTKIDDLRVG